jgi:hypothetical protein
MSKMNQDYGYRQSGARGWVKNVNPWDRRYGRTEDEVRFYDALEFMTLGKGITDNYKENEKLENSHEMER